MKSRVVLPLSLLVAGAMGFAGGLFVQKRHVADHEKRSQHPSRLETAEIKTDVLIASSSSRAGFAPGEIEKTETLPDPSQDFSDAKKRESVQGYLRKIPFGLLKGVFLERQDKVFEKTVAEYSSGYGTDEENEKRADELFARYNGGSNYYIATGEWRLRGGRVVEYLLLLDVHSSSSTDKPATRGSDFCWMANLYVQADGVGTGNEGLGSCLSSTSLRNGYPFAVFGNYSSSVLSSFFDSIAVPLPGFNGDPDSPQWFDATTEKWVDLSRVRWNETTQTEYKAREREENTKLHPGN